jgi:hypothetical protein
MWRANGIAVFPAPLGREQALYLIFRVGVSGGRGFDFRTFAAMLTGFAALSRSCSKNEPQNADA